MCIRDSQNPMSTEEAVEKLLGGGKFDMRVGLENYCGIANCGWLGGALVTKDGDDIPGDRKYMNAGVIVGKAGKMIEALQWALDEGYTDDQVGLSSFVRTHPDRIVGDKDRLMVSNLLGDADEDAAAAGRLPVSVFAHMPSLNLKLQQRNAYNGNLSLIHI